MDRAVRPSGPHPQRGFAGPSHGSNITLIRRVDAEDMKIHVFVDDGQPESWECDDNYYDLDDLDLESHVLGPGDPAGAEATARWRERPLRSRIRRWTPILRGLRRAR